MHDYCDCIYCGGQVTEQQLPREVRWKGRLYLVEDVPMGVCEQCGEKFLKPDVAKTIDALLERGKPSKKIEVPVLPFVAGVA